MKKVKLLRNFNDNPILSQIEVMLIRFHATIQNGAPHNRDAIIVRGQSSSIAG